MASGAHNGNFSYTQRQSNECEMSSKRVPTCKFDAFVLDSRARDLHFSPRRDHLSCMELVAIAIRVMGIFRLSTYKTTFSTKRITVL